MADPIRVIVAELRAIGLKPHAIAGVLGNLSAESSFNPNASNGTHQGLAQWNYSRWARFNRLRRENGWGAENSVEAQTKYIAWEIKTGKGGTTVARMNRTSSPREAAIVFEDEYERSGRSRLDVRIAAARQYRKDAGRGGKGTKSSKTYTWVEGGTVSQRYGNPSSRYEAGAHTGVDISAEQGTKIRWAPPVSGRVVRANDAGGAYGNHMIIRDEKNRDWLFAHMASEPLKVGTRVEQGQVIGRVGSTGTSTGAHLHLEQTPQGVKWSYGLGPTKNPLTEFQGDGGSPGGINGPGGRTQKANYGYLFNAEDYLDLPENAEIADIVRKGRRKGWSEERLRQELKNTEWYRNRTQAQRTFDTSDPQEQKAQFRQSKAEVRRIAASLGVVLTKDELQFEAMRRVRDGDSNDQLRYWLGSQYEYDPEASQSGFAQEFQEELDDMANNYGFKVTKKMREEWTQQAIQGGLDASAWEDDMREAAQLRFPQLNLKSRTLREALTPWLSSAAEELGTSIDAFDLSKGKWVDVVDPETQQMLSDQQWRLKVRTDKRYGWEGTDAARREYSMLASGLSRLFGSGMSYGRGG